MNKTGLLESLVNTLILTAQTEDTLYNIRDWAGKLVLRDKMMELVLHNVEKDIFQAVLPDNRTMHTGILIAALNKHADGLKLEHPLGAVEYLPVAIESMKRKLTAKTNDLTKWITHTPADTMEIAAVNSILTDILRHLFDLQALFQTMTEKAFDSATGYRNAFELYRRIGTMFDNMISNHNMQKPSIKQLHESFDQLKSNDFGNAAKESIMALASLAQQRCNQLAESTKSGLHKLRD